MEGKAAELAVGALWAVDRGLADVSELEVPERIVLSRTTTFDAANEGQRLSGFAVEGRVDVLRGSLSTRATAATSYGPASQRLGLGVC
jgi:hypothetical protein